MPQSTTALNYAAIRPMIVVFMCFVFMCFVPFRRAKLLCLCCAALNYAAILPMIVVFMLCFAPFRRAKLLCLCCALSPSAEPSCCPPSSPQRPQGLLPEAARCGCGCTCMCGRACVDLNAFCASMQQLPASLDFLLNHCYQLSTISFCLINAFNHHISYISG